LIPSTDSKCGVDSGSVDMGATTFEHDDEPLTFEVDGHNMVVVFSMGVGEPHLKVMTKL